MAYLDQLRLRPHAVLQRVNFLKSRADNQHFFSESKHYPFIVSLKKWQQNISKATLLSEAGQLAILFEKEISGVDTKQTFIQATSIYREWELPYGFFLQALFDPENLEIESLGTYLGSALDYWSNEWGGFGGPKENPAENWIMAPNQVLYGCLAAAGLYNLLPDINRDQLLSLTSDLERHALRPHGAQSLPFGNTLLIVRLLIGNSLNPDNINYERNIGMVRKTLSGFAYANQNTISAAQKNPYLWNNLRSPVAWLDLDMVAFSAFLSRQIDSKFIQENIIQNLPMAGRIPFEVGIGLTRN